MYWRRTCLNYVIFRSFFYKISYRKNYESIISLLFAFLECKNREHRTRVKRVLMYISWEAKVQDVNGCVLTFAKQRIMSIFLYKLVRTGGF